MKLDVHGHAVYAYTGGKAFDPTLPCVVLIHGALNDHSVWGLQSRYLAHHGHGVLAVDLPGHCRSAGAPPPSVEAAADWVGALLDAAGVRTAALAGHSMGSLIALEAAARLGERVTHLAMVGTTYPMKVSAALLEGALKTPLDAIDLVNKLSHGSMASKPSAPGPGAWLHGGGRALMRRVLASNREVNLFHHDFSLCDRYQHGLQAAAQVKAPVLMVLGDRDQMTLPGGAAELALALHAKVVDAPAGHSLMTEAPGVVLDALLDLLGHHATT